MEHDAVERQVWQELEPALQAQGYELIEVEFATSTSGRALQLYVDHANGVTLDDCARVSRYASALLDKADLIAGRYMLEVSSPGLERPVRKPPDFARFAGEAIRVTCRAPIAGQRQFHGILRGFSDGMVLLECEGAPVSVHLENLKKAHLVR